MVKKVIQNPHTNPDHHRKLTTSKESPLAYVYHVWSTSVTAILSYPAHRQNVRANGRVTDSITERPVT